MATSQIHSNPDTPTSPLLNYMRGKCHFSFAMYTDFFAKPFRDN